MLILTPKSDGPAGVLNNLGFLSTLFPGILDKSIRENVPSSLSSTCWSLTVSLYVFSSDVDVSSTSSPSGLFSLNLVFVSFLTSSSDSLLGTDRLVSLLSFTFSCSFVDE